MPLRIAQAADRDGILQLIDQVLQEYGDRICLEPQGAEADLLNIDSHYLQPGGAFWVWERATPSGLEIAGTHAALRDESEPGTCHFKRLYLAPDLRGGGAGRQLMQAALDWAAATGCARVQFWSDTRFQRAHRFFEKFGFRRTGVVRTMTDSHAPYREFEFALELR